MSTFPEYLLDGLCQLRRFWLAGFLLSLVMLGATVLTLILDPEGPAASAILLFTFGISSLVVVLFFAMYAGCKRYDGTNSAK